MADRSPGEPTAPQANKPISLRHLITQRGELERRYEILTKRIEALDIDIGRELDNERKLVLGDRRTDLVAEREKIAAELQRIEQQIADSRLQPLAGTIASPELATPTMQLADPVPAQGTDTQGEPPRTEGHVSRDTRDTARRAKLAVWSLAGVLVVAIVGLVFFRQMRCLVEYRLSEAVVGLIVFLAGGAGLAFSNLAPPSVRRALQAFYGGMALALLVLVLLISLKPVLNPESCQAGTAPPPQKSPSETATPPSPTKVTKAVFLDDFEGTRYWTEGSDTNGRSWYGEGSYHVVSQSSVSGWVWVLPEGTPTSKTPVRRYTDAVVEIDAVPVSDGRVTGYGLVFGWEKGNNYYLFEVQPTGKCGFQRVQAHAPIETFFDWVCPSPAKNAIAQVRLEIKQGRVRAFINGQYIGEHGFPDYRGGLLGLETYNGGTVESQIAAQVKFDNLVVWDYSE